MSYEEESEIINDQVTTSANECKLNNRNNLLFGINNQIFQQSFFNSWNSFTKSDNTSILIQNETNEFLNLKDSKQLLSESENYFMSEIFDSNMIFEQKKDTSRKKSSSNDHWIESTEKNLNSLIDETENILKSLLVDDSFINVSCKSKKHKKIIFNNKIINLEDENSLTTRRAFNEERKLKIQIDNLTRKIDRLEYKRQKKLLQWRQKKIFIKNSIESNLPICFKSTYS